ncbi:sigma-70 family RNA polymerase sigma factor [Vibrio sp. CAU 1672]|uniref:sigma-70 family RNA polymerase sigma factor n=1 Tax=Vibrio sp. CAU 1672 TaxID=3032594 RepID=UPI0023DC4501|nr:sigma-70 family RNA polymerase sigma factor [Vibrio sp. CAU 1672]MDF2155373.1 sigma-70 family RNA polymerase sigma factor [Vibrio sp. CAU 1672]
MQAWNHAEPSLYGWLIKQTHSHHEAEDIMQEVFLKAMSNSERFCSLQDGKSWLFKITKNHLIDNLRRKIQAVDIDDLPAPSDVVPAVARLQHCLPKVLVKLSDQERDVIEQCDLNGMTQREYAQRHQLSLPAVKARLRRARAELKSILITECKVTQDQTGVCCFGPNFINSK